MMCMYVCMYVLYKTYNVCTIQYLVQCMYVIYSVYNCIHVYIMYYTVHVYIMYYTVHTCMLRISNALFIHIHGIMLYVHYVCILQANILRFGCWLRQRRGGGGLVRPSALSEDRGHRTTALSLLLCQRSGLRYHIAATRYCTTTTTTTTTTTVLLLLCFT